MAEQFKFTYDTTSSQLPEMRYYFNYFRHIAILETCMKLLKEMQSKVGFFNRGFSVAVFRDSWKMPVERDIVRISTSQSSHASQLIRIWWRKDQEDMLPHSLG